MKLLPKAVRKTGQDWPESRLKRSNKLKTRNKNRKALKILPAKKILQSKKKIGEFYIPTRQNLWKNAILNLMYNDNAIYLNYLSFRTVKDVFYLESKALYKNLSLFHNSFNHFYNLLSIYD